MKKAGKIVLRIVLGVLALLVLAFCVYFLYFILSYHRIADHQQLTPAQNAPDGAAAPDTPYTFTTYNIGFGAYSSDYSFFMDGGTESWAFSKQAVLDNTAHMLDTISGETPDFAYFQEVDLDSTRSYHVNQMDLIARAFPSMSLVDAVDFDSPFLFYPLTQPHGRAYSSIVTLSRFPVASAERRSLPIDKGFSKYLDLDRCFSVSEVPVSNGKSLYLYNVHLSAYSNESGTVESQVRLLAEDMAARAEGGNYIIVGGDFNQDMLGNSAEVFGTTGEYSWTRAFDTSLLPAGFHVVAPTDPDNILPTCRLADAPYVAGQSFVITIDSFIVSENISVSELSTMDTGFAWSDHNPVRMRFSLDA